MGLFSAFSKKTVKNGKKETVKKNNKVSSKSEEKILGVYTFTQHSNFRGFKRLKLTCFGYEPITKGIDALKIPNPKYIPPADGKPSSDNPEYIFDIKGKTIEVQQVRYGPFESEICLRVFIDNNHIGTYFIHDDYDKSIYDAFSSDKVEQVHIRFDTDINVVGVKQDKLVYDVRYFTYLFIKMKE